MQRHFDEELRDLHQDILKMGTFAEEAIVHSVEALRSQDRRLAQVVIDQDARVDELELIIDEKCLDLIARHQPMAADLRFISTGMKLNGELERIADIAVDIADRVLILADEPVLKPLVDIPKLSTIAQIMVKLAIHAFIARDAELARKVMLYEPEADALRNAIHKELVEDYMVKDPSTCARAVQLLLIGRFLERICDHATYIAEDVIYMIKGEVVKHHPER
ncbi:MAG: phosphate signaling complex protein PhoU, partial [Candidatus Omnitrophica bacterium]|nr:phosphate signaling complex protein PhoU [Candidatus Omnitrophota bacterium]